MHILLNAWADKLQLAKIPVLPVTVEEINRLVLDDNTQTWQLARAAERDPGFCIALLRHVHELRKNNLRSEINTVEKAIMLLGLSKLHALLPTLTLLKTASASPQFMQILTQSYHAAWQAREFARLRKDMEPDEIFLAALLHCSGALLLCLHAPKKMQQIILQMQKNGISPEEAQFIVLGFGLNHLSIVLARAWNLPSLLRESLKAECAQHPRAYGIMLAVQLARAANQGWYHAGTNAVLEQLAEYTGYNFSQTATFAHRFAVEAAQNAHESYPAVPAAVHLLYPVQPEEQPLQSTEPCKLESVAATPAAQAAFCLAPQLHILQRSQRALHTGIKTGSVNFKNTVSLAMDALHDGMGLNRVVFTLLSQQQLRAHAIAGADNDPKFSRFKITLNGSQNLFSSLMEKPQSLWVNATNRAQFQPLLPETFQNTINCESFFLLSLFVRGKPAGLLYADRGRSGSPCSLDGHAYHRFKQTGRLIMQAMEIALQQKHG